MKEFLMPATREEALVVREYWDGLEIAAREKAISDRDEFINASAGEMIRKIVSAIKDWPEYREAVFEEVINAGRIQVGGVIFSRNGIRWAIDRFGRIEGGRYIRMEIRARSLSSKMDPPKYERMARDNYWENVLSLYHSKPNSQHGGSIRYKSPESPTVESSDPYQNDYLSMVRDALNFVDTHFTQ